VHTNSYKSRLYELISASLASWMAHCRKFCEAHGLSFGEDLYRAVAEFQDGGEWPEGELSVQVAVDSLVELLKERIDQIIAFSRKEDWRKRKEIADIAFSYFLLMKIHHWQISHRK
jgi:hypothetical protein